MRRPAAFLGVSILVFLVSAAAAGAQTLTLAEAVARARQQSPAAMAARTRVAAAEAAARLVPTLPNPSLELRSENWTALPRDSFAVLTQPIELGGRVAARRATAQAAVDARQAAAQGTGLDLTRLVVGQYVEALRAREARGILAGQRDSLVDIVRVLTERTAAGAAPEADLRKFESERARVESQVVRLEVRLETALRQLSAVAGGSPIEAGALVLPALPPPLTAGDLATAIERRPDVAAARGRVGEARAALAAARAVRVPELLVSGGYKRTAGVDTGVAAVSVAVPLFDRNAGGLARASGEVTAAEQELAFVRARAAADAGALLASAARLAGFAATVERDQVAPAAIVQSAARAAFNEGAGDVLRLVDAERVLADARRDLLDIQLDALLAAIEARLAVGEEPLP
jgi:cobalt-zinc-cadmium efflux system outer membrane protein